MKTKIQDVTGQFVDSMLLDLSIGSGPVPRRCLSAWLAGKAIDVTLNPNGYRDAKDFAVDYQAVRLLKKFPGGDPNLRRSKAIQVFLDAERTCGATNERFTSPCNLPPHLWTQLNTARDFIHKVVGEFSWDDAIQHCDFGPGASVGVTRKQRHLVHKIGLERPTVTPDCSALAAAYKRLCPRIGVHLHDFDVVHGSRVTTVPKDAKIDRVIAVEPVWNMFFQKGIGGLISRRLQRRGLEIKSQQARNREFARLGSLLGTYATLDLSAASDSISLYLIRYLFPSSWYEAMASTRSWYCEVDGTLHLLEKISSMGNGYTFELETLLFLALTYAASPSTARSVNVDIAAYGDDIICRPEVATGLIELLTICGFKTNVEKSFVTGPFRESCGGHYFDGFDVTPYHLDKRLESVHDIFWAINSVQRWAARMGANLYRDARVRGTCDFLVKRLPHRFQRLKIPDGIGDTGLIASFDEATPQAACTAAHGEIAWKFPTFQRIPRTIKAHSEAGLTTFLYKDGGKDQRVVDPRLIRWTRVPKWDVSMRDDGLDRVTELETGFRLLIRPSVYVGQWPWLGPWA